MNKPNRDGMLDALLQFSLPVDILQRELQKLDWDSAGEVVELKSDHFIRVLQRFLSLEVTVETVEGWANLVEGREDIAFEPSQEDVLKDVLFELANPFLMQSLTFARARELMENLSNS